MDIIVDIDGTLANIEHRLHFIKGVEPMDASGVIRTKRPDWDAFFDACDKDTPIEAVCELVNSLGAFDYGYARNQLIFATGRPKRVCTKTIVWLDTFVKAFDQGFTPLYMRKDGDHRPDHVVKKELLGKMRADGYEPKLAIDDRQQVVDMWRAEGLICAQVAKGDF